MKLLYIMLTSLALVGCASNESAKQDQLILEVPKQLMVPPEPLKQL